MRAFLEKYAEGIFIMIIAMTLIFTAIPLAALTKNTIQKNTDDYLEYIEESDYSKSAPGLYDKEMNLIATWGTLTAPEKMGGYEMDITKNYTATSYTAETSAYSVLKEERFKAGRILVVDSHVELIGTYALSNTNLTKIVLPNTINVIQTGTFASSEKLQTVQIPKSVKVVESKAFYNCSNLNVILNTNVKTVASDAFSNVKTLCYRGGLAGSPWGAKGVHLGSDKCELCGYSTSMAVVDFDYNGGIGSEVVNIEVDYGLAYGNLPYLEKDGYDFDGWYTAETGGNKVTNSTPVSIKGDHTLYAKWIEKEYTITFNINKGSGSTTPKCSTTSKNVKYNSEYGTLPTATRKGYTFDGWYTEETGGSKVTKYTKMKETMSHTLYAHWVPMEYSITFDVNPGTGDTVPNCSTSSMFVKFDATYGELPIPTRVNYSFSGWYTEPDGGDLISDSTVVTKTEKHTLYAHWTKQ